MLPPLVDLVTCSIFLPGTTAALASAPAINSIRKKTAVKMFLAILDALMDVVRPEAIQNEADE